MAMDAITPNKDKARAEPIKRPTVQEAEEAVRTLIAWAGDDPRREGLLDTPKRVVNAYKEWFSGYEEDPVKYLSRTFEDVQGYDDIVMLRNIDVESHCEHHMAPFLGKAYVAYMPSAAVVGISKLARVVEIFSKRLQTQETMTAQICDAITDSLNACRHGASTTRMSARSPRSLLACSNRMPICAIASCVWPARAEPTFSQN